MNLLEKLGYTEQLKLFRIENQLQEFDVGRVMAEHKERYLVKTECGEYDAEITGNLRYTAIHREDFPAVGDWVALTVFDDTLAIIHKIFPRHSIIGRQAKGSTSERQILAVNVDFALLVQAVDRDFNLNRLERYLTIAYEANVKPIVILTKSDLLPADELNSLIDQLKIRIKKVPVIAISNLSQNGFDELNKVFKPRKTYCLLGSSGVGKSTLINNLLETEILKTQVISDSTHKGKHTTTHRELFLLLQGGIIIDNPGLREVGITDASHGLATTFDTIVVLSSQCKYQDCSHMHEDGCAVLDALEKGAIDSDSYENYLKMEREKEHYESSVAERRQKDKKFGKMLKDYHKKDVKKRDI